MPSNKILTGLLAASLLGFGAAAQAQVPPRADLDRDGIPNQFDRDRDGDGIPNARDPRPDRYDRVARNDRANRYPPMHPLGDLDRDGIRNRDDRDRDGDRVANHRDRWPDDRRRW